MEYDEDFGSRTDGDGKTWNNPDIYFITEPHLIKNPAKLRGYTIFKTQTGVASSTAEYTQTSLLEAGINEAFMVRPKLTKNFLKTGYLSDADGDLLLINSVLHPDIEVHSVDWRTMSYEQRTKASYRKRVSHVDVISYINSVKDWCVDLKTVFDFRSNKMVLPFTDYYTFMRHCTELVANGQLKYPEFRFHVDDILNNHQDKQCFGDTIATHIDGGKVRHIQYEISQIIDGSSIYSIRKQLDFALAFLSEGTSVIMIVDSPAHKKIALDMRGAIGRDFPIFTKHEFQSYRNAKFYAYQDMCVTFDAQGIPSTDRSKFSYEDFIRGLHRHSDPTSTDFTYWNIDPATAKLIMMSFGLNEHGDQIGPGEYLKWKSPKHPKSSFIYTYEMGYRLAYWFHRYNVDDYQDIMEDRNQNWFH